MDVDRVDILRKTIPLPTQGAPKPPIHSPLLFSLVPGRDWRRFSNTQTRGDRLRKRLLQEMWEGGLIRLLPNSKVLRLVVGRNDSPGQK